MTKSRQFDQGQTWNLVNLLHHLLLSLFYSQNLDVVAKIASLEKKQSKLCLTLLFHLHTKAWMQADTHTYDILWKIDLIIRLRPFLANQTSFLPSDLIENEPTNHETGFSMAYPVCEKSICRCVCMCGGLHRLDVMRCEWTAVTESGEQAFPTMHMRTEGGTHKLIVAARATCRQIWLLLQSCASKLTLNACVQVHTHTYTHAGFHLVSLINKSKAGD